MIIMPTVIFVVSMEYLIRQIPNDYSYKNSYLEKHSGEIQILISGASDAFCGINPVFFPQNVFNAGHLSQPLYLDFEIFKKFQFKKLETIIFVMGYPMLFWNNLDNTPENWRLAKYTIYYGFNSGSLRYNSELLNNTFRMNLKRLGRCYITKKNDITCNSLGWLTSFTAVHDLNESGKNFAKYDTFDIFSKEITKVLDENVEVLNSFLNICDNQKITVIFLTTPTYFTFWENLNPEQLNIMIKTMNDLVIQHSNCHYLNWLSSTDFVAEDFYDATHLNETGAKKLSEKIAREIDLLGTWK